MPPPSRFMDGNLLETLCQMALVRYVMSSAMCWVFLTYTTPTMQKMDKVIIPEVGM